MPGRLRTTAAITVVVTLALGLGTWVLLLTLERALLRSNDDAARSRARDIAVQMNAGTLSRPLPALGDDSIAQVVDGSGRVLAASRNVEGRSPVATFRPGGSRAAVRTVDFQDGPDLERYRVWAVIAEGPTGPATVYVGSSLELVDEAVATLRGLLVPALPVAVLILATLTWVVVGRLLSRLEASSRRQRVFAADASHELQSPLTTFRTQLEVALASERSADWPSVARDLLRQSQEMERLVRELLFLAREDELADARPPRDLVDLDDVVLEEAARLRAAARVPVDTSNVSAAPVRGSRDQLGRLVRNLLENAERHAVARVDVSLSARNGEVVLTVLDDGPGVPAEDRGRIFERFVRLDDARSRDAGGAGLGLAIVAAVARRHGGSVSVEDVPTGARFEVRLPSAP